VAAPSKSRAGETDIIFRHRKNDAIIMRQETSRKKEMGGETKKSFFRPKDLNRKRDSARTTLKKNRGEMTLAIQDAIQEDKSSTLLSPKKKKRIKDGGMKRGS